MMKYRGFNFKYCNYLFSFFLHVCLMVQVMSISTKVSCKNQPVSSQVQIKKVKLKQLYMLSFSCAPVGFN